VKHYNLLSITVRLIEQDIKEKNELDTDRQQHEARTEILHGRVASNG
jgi:hypothetical protein